MIHNQREDAVGSKRQSWPPRVVVVSPQREPSPPPVTLTELMAVLLSQMLFSGCQLDNLVLINKIKEQLMAEKIRPPHLPTASAPSQQPLLPPSSHADGVQHGMSKGQQMPVLHSHSPSQPDVAVHPRSASSSVTGTLDPAPVVHSHRDGCFSCQIAAPQSCTGARSIYTPYFSQSTDTCGDETFR